MLSWKKPTTSPLKNSNEKPKIIIKLPPDAHIGYDPFSNPNEEFLPIDDTFRQTVYPVDENYHIQCPKKTQENIATGICSPDETKVVRTDTQLLDSPEALMGDAATPLPLDEKVKFMAVGADGINEYDYNHGLLPREDINKMLKDPGDFLIRITSISGNGTRQMCLSVMGKTGQVEHFVIRAVDGKFWLTEDVSFDNIINLVNHYLLKKIPFGNPPVSLNKPVCRQDWEFRPDQVRCEKPIGAGAFGQVYFGKARLKVNDPEFDVAVKTMKFTLMTKENIEEIMKEARLMRMLRHTNIVRCYGVSADSEPLMILMEFVKGGALDKYLSTLNVQISITDRIDMTYGAACGLNHIHRHGIVHRDIAARNCLYGDKVVKLTDFGLSRQSISYKIDPSEKAPIKSLAPEVFLSQIYTPAADVWAYGVLVWEIFNNGSEPYVGWSSGQIKQEVVRKGNSLVMPDWTPAFLKEVLLKVFAVNPNDRIKMFEIVKHIYLSRIKKPTAGKKKLPMADSKLSNVFLSRELLVRNDRPPRKYKGAPKLVMSKELVTSNLKGKKKENRRPPKFRQTKDRLPKDKLSREKLSREKLSKEKVSKVKLSRELVSKENLSKEQVTKENNFSKEQVTKESNFSKERLPKNKISKIMQERTGS